MFEKAKALEHKVEKLVHFELGEPDFDIPQHIKKQLNKCLTRARYTRYTLNAGLLEIREALAEKHKRDNEIEADPATEICVTVGAQEAVYLAVMCTIEPGDQVLIRDPGYYTYRNCVLMAGGIPVSVPLRKENGFRLDPEELEIRITSKSKMIVINSPSNPTGFVMTKDY